MNIKEVKGLVLKKLMGAERSSFRWHNKNNNGGNFGIEIRGIEGKNYEISADYNSLGNFFQIRFGYIYEAGMRMNLEMNETVEQLCERLKKVIDIQRKIDKRFHEINEEVA